jgi:UDPglucose--hexose-1-phosphate uridylyltransferase
MVRNRDDSTTNEMRHDWLADRWVIIAPQRTERPQDFVQRASTILDSTSCPFCFGHEESTPEAVACYRSRRSDLSRWDVRVVPNKFPAVNSHLDRFASVPILETNGVYSQSACPDGRIHDGHILDSTLVARHTSPEHAKRAQTREARNGKSINLFRRRGLTGGHEVIVESPHHLQSITQLDRETTGLVFRAYRDRLAYWLKQRGLSYAVVFKNVGLDAGASLAHTHSQLIATDLLPTDVERAAKRMELYREKEAACLFCRMAEDELEQSIRVVEETPDFVAFCPFASRLPALVTILPKQHQSQFEKLAGASLDQLSWLTHRLVRRVEHCFPETAYNFVIHTAPASHQGSDAFHWRLELFPRLTKVAGFEWGSDCYINPLAPENAAHALRQAGV